MSSRTNNPHPAIATCGSRGARGIYIRTRITKVISRTDSALPTREQRNVSRLRSAIGKASCSRLRQGWQAAHHGHGQSSPSLDVDYALIGLAYWNPETICHKSNNRPSCRYGRDKSATGQTTSTKRALICRPPRGSAAATLVVSSVLASTAGMASALVFAEAISL